MPNVVTFITKLLASIEEIFAK